MSKQNKPNKAEEKPNIRLNKASIDRLIIDTILPELSKGTTFPELNRLLQLKYNKSHRQCAEYLKRATEALQKDFNRSVEQQRMELISALRADLREAERQYQVCLGVRRQAGAQGWFKIIQEIRSKIAYYGPRELKAAEQAQDKLNITIKYEDA